MSKYKTMWGMYHINVSRTEGYSDFFETYEQALDARNHAPQIGLCYVLEQTYELEEDSHHDCGDDE